MPLDHWRKVLERGERLREQSAVIRAHSAVLRQRTAFTALRLKRLRHRSADLATIVLFQGRLPARSQDIWAPLRLLA